METKEPKELKIVAPEGYELDKENSTLERIVFKKKFEGKPRSWEEFCKRGFTGEEGCITYSGAAKTIHEIGHSRSSCNTGYVDSVQEAEAFVALMQLRQLRKAWIGDWEPDWRDGSFKYIIGNEYDYIKICTAVLNSGPISFPTIEMAEEFMECFKDLLEQAKMLL